MSTISTLLYSKGFSAKNCYLILTKSKVLRSLQQYQVPSSNFYELRNRGMSLYTYKQLFIINFML